MPELPHQLKVAEEAWRVQTPPLPCGNAYEHSKQWLYRHNWICTDAPLWILFKGRDPRDQTNHVYVTTATNKLFLNREACEDLGLISPDFPTVGDALPDVAQVDSADSSTSPPSEPCDCPRLQKWLLQYYRSSAFNTCTHKPLNMMNTTPMRLMINDKAVPRVHHKPHTVSLHHQGAVKEDIDADCALGILEPVPIGDPVTWCHQMVIGTKEKRETTPHSGLPSIEYPLHP